jgi:hypothetical protein
MHPSNLTLNFKLLNGLISAIELVDTEYLLLISALYCKVNNGGVITKAAEVVYDTETE